MSGPPSSRYRVVEEGRRLVVIDRWASEGRPDSISGEGWPPPAPPQSPPLPTSSSSSLWSGSSGSPGQPRANLDAAPPRPSDSGLRFNRNIGGDPGVELHTHAFFDAKGPRTIRLAPGSSGISKALQAVVIIFVVLTALSVMMSPIALLLVVAVVFQGRAKFRSAITLWLDTLESEAG